MTGSHIKLLGLWGLWLGFIGYAFLLAPPDQPETLNLITRLATAQIDGINPLIVSLFNAMGLFPLIYSAVLLADGRMQSIRAYPFVLASFAVGAFGLLPYLAMRQTKPVFSGRKGWLLSVLDSRWFAVPIALGAFVLAVYGLCQGNWVDFIAQWRTSRFIHVMSLDFCLLSLLFPLVLRDDMARRGMGDRRWCWLLALVPVLGSALYLVVRSPLQEAVPDATQLSQSTFS
jgi:hypothetical protein